MNKRIDWSSLKQSVSAEVAAKTVSKKSRKLPNTPRSRIKSALHKLFLRSRERAAALKRDGYTCCVCRAKQSRASGREIYVEVHHKNGVRWTEIIDYIFAQLLVDPSKLETLCTDCHKKEHAK